MIHVRLNILPETNNCLSENQFGFRKHHATNDAPIATIKYTPFKLIELYLTNRKQYTYINDAESAALISTQQITARFSFGSAAISYIHQPA